MMAAYRVTVVWPAERWAALARQRSRRYRGLRASQAGSFAAFARRAAATATLLGVPVGLAIRAEDSVPDPKSGTGGRAS